MSLTKPALSAFALEAAALDLWIEFLGTYFDGLGHVVGGHPSIIFPKAEFLAQKALPPHPMESGPKTTPLAIHIVWITPSPTRRRSEPMPVTGARQDWVTQRGTFHFYVRCSAVDAGAGNADYQCSAASDKLCGLLNNSAATRPLAAKGIHGLASTTPVLVVNGTGGDSKQEDYAVRMLTATARLRYPILSQS